jgi:DNA-binding FadR family transcriptional regulator
MGTKNILSKIKPINTSSLVDKVELRLWEYFEENNLKPGDALPKEVDLSRELGVSRTVVREAFSRLRTLGFIDSKKNRGMVLTRPDVLSSFEKVLNPKI